MKLSTWAEVVGVIAVVISLALLTWELNQANNQTALNTRALELAAYQQLIERISEFNLATIQNPELRVVREKVESGAELSSDEAAILNAFLYLAYRNGDLAYLQYEQEIIDEQRLRSGLGLMINLLELPLIQKHWESAQQGFVDSYRDYINQLIVEINQGATIRVSGTQLLLDASGETQAEKP